MAVSAIASPIGKVDVSAARRARGGTTRPGARGGARARGAVRAHLLVLPVRRPHAAGRRATTSSSGWPRSPRWPRTHEVTLVHENEKDIYGDVPARVLDLDRVRRVGAPAGGLGQRELRPGRRAALHRRLRAAAPLPRLPAGQGRARGDGTVVPAGEGDGELLETVTALRDDGYTGFASLEPHLAIVHASAASPARRQFGRAARAFAALTAQIGVGLVMTSTGTITRPERRPRRRRVIARNHARAIDRTDELLLDRARRPRPGAGRRAPRGPRRRRARRPEARRFGSLTDALAAGGDRPGRHLHAERHARRAGAGGARGRRARGGREADRRLTMARAARGARRCRRGRARSSRSSASTGSTRRRVAVARDGRTAAASAGSPARSRRWPWWRSQEYYDSGRRGAARGRSTAAAP